MKKILVLCFCSFLCGCGSGNNTTKVLQVGHRYVSYIKPDGEECALVQCASDDDLCLVTVDIRMIQKHVLGRDNAIRYAENYCHPTKTVQLGE